MSEKIIIDREKLAAAAEVITVAEHVYNPKDAVPSEWQIVDRSEIENSGFFAALYVKSDADPEKTRYMIAFRGASSLKGLSSLFSILSCRLPKQHHQALAYVEHVAKTFNIDPGQLELTGHSLGGYLARSVGEAIGVKSIWAFNSPGPTSDMRQAFAGAATRKVDPQNMVHVRSRYDIISRWGYDHGTVIELDTIGYHHGVSDLRGLLQSGVAVQNMKQSSLVATGKKSLRVLFNEAANNFSRYASLSRRIEKLIRKLFYEPGKKRK